RRTVIGVWFIARRLGAPLDRFSIHILDSATFLLSQDLDVQIRRAINVLDELNLQSDRELFNLVGTFKSSISGESIPDPRLAQLGGPIARQIDLDRQAIRILEPGPAAATRTMSISEYVKVVQQIIDNLVLFGSQKEAGDVSKGKRTPRLGFDFTPLTIRVRI